MSTDFDRVDGTFSAWLCYACTERLIWLHDRCYTCVTFQCPRKDIPVVLPLLFTGGVN